MSIASKEPICYVTRDQIERLAVPDSPDVHLDKRFFPRSSLLTLLTRDKVREVLSCRCARCEKHLKTLKENELFRYIDRIVGKPGGDQNPAFTAISLFALLIYIRYPLFVVNFLEQGLNCNDQDLTTNKKVFTEQYLRSTYWPTYHEQQPNDSKILASNFRWRLYQFAVPHLTDDKYTKYDEWTILPFFDEQALGTRNEDGEFVHEGAHGKVFSFRIWDEYKSFPDVRRYTKFARKELNSTSSRRFHDELNNLERVRQFQDDHIIRIIKSYRLGNKFVLLFPCAETNLALYLRSPRSDEGYNAEDLLEMNPLWRQMLGITSALSRINGSNIKSGASGDQFYGYHFDLKGENILVEESGRLVISDFGQATFKKANGTSSKVTGMGGTEAYAPPEIDNLDVRPNRKYDVWSFGCILVEVSTFVISRQAGVQNLDRLRLTNIPGTNRADDRFFQRKRDGTGYELKPQMLFHIENIPFSRVVDNAKTRSFLTDIVKLAKQMLEVDVDARITCKNAALTLQLILDNYQKPVQITGSNLGKEHGPTIGDLGLGSKEVEFVCNVRHHSKGHQATLDRGFLRLIEGRETDPNHIQILVLADSSNANEIYRMTVGPDTKLIPGYALRTRNDRQPLRRELSLEKVISCNAAISECSDVFLAQLHAPVALQAQMSKQAICHSLEIGKANFSVTSKRAIKIKSMWKESKASLSIDASHLANVIQLWIDTSSEHHFPPISPQSSARGQRIDLPLSPVTRRVVIYFETKIVTIRLAKNVRLQKTTSESNPQLIRWIPTDETKDKSFTAAVLSRASERSLPGIPLDKSSFLKAESAGSFECTSFDVLCNTIDDATKLTKAYRLLKSSWKAEMQDYERRLLRAGYTLD